MKHLTILSWLFFVATASAADPIQIIGATNADQPLPPVPGVTNVEVFHAKADGWTYNHHVDLGAWSGRLYLGWDACEKDEDVGISRELYSTSNDGFHWTEPQLLFPQGISTAMRMYFFHAPNGHMLAVAGLRVATNVISEAIKNSLIVREIRTDHSLGNVFLLKKLGESTGTNTTVAVPPSYTNSTDRKFIEACQQLLANKPFLEQQDYGRLLGGERMKWHNVALWAADEPSRAEFNRFGKAMCFYHRADGALVALMKWGWVMISRDEGNTWSPPVRPSTLTVGMAKVWGQKTSNGKYVLFYNPHLLNRFPLVMVQGSDGITFGDMRIVNGARPPLRFPGLYKAEGPQYVRGISEWSNDGSWKDDGVWIAYSMNKEDIWISRVPVAAVTGEQRR